MKKFYEWDSNKTAMQFAKEIICKVNVGVLDGAPMDSCTKELHKALTGVHGSSIAHLVEDLVEDATGKSVFVTIASQEVWDYPYIKYEVHVEWDVTNKDY